MRILKKSSWVTPRVCRFACWAALVPPPITSTAISPPCLLETRRSTCPRRRNRVTVDNQLVELQPHSRQALGEPSMNLGLLLFGDARVAHRHVELAPVEPHLDCYGRPLRVRESRARLH